MILHKNAEDNNILYFVLLLFLLKLHTIYLLSLKKSIIQRSIRYVRHIKIIS